MERPIFQPVGTPVEELDTPALVVDLGVVERNISTFHNAFRGTGYGAEPANAGAQVRPHVSCHGCPEIARLQLAADNGIVCAPDSNLGGIAVGSLGEAEVFAGAGFDSIVIADRIVTPGKIRRLLALARQVSVTVTVDDANNVHLISEAAVDAESSLDVLVEVDIGRGFGGVTSGPSALELARAVHQAPALRFQGISGDEGPVSTTDASEREAETRRRLQPLLDTLSLLEGAGIGVSAICSGNTTNYEVVAGIPGITEVLAGIYPLMDMQTLAVRPELEPAAKVLATVISHPVPERAVVDAGHKTMGPDFGVPTLAGVPGAIATRFSAEHGILELDGSAREQLAPNDKVSLIPFNLALCVNQFDYFRAVRNGRLVGYWPIATRGRLD